MIGFTLVGLLISREWGWSEYASDELYVVYHQGAQRPTPFFLVNADGSGETWALTTNNEIIVNLDCSPDGRTLAFVTDLPHLYVINQTGIIFDRTLDRVYKDVSFQVANNGLVTYQGELFVDANDSHPLIAPHGYEGTSATISSWGFFLWKYANGGIEAVNSAGDTVIFVRYGYAPRWLASEKLFVFSSPYGMPRSRQLLADAMTQQMVLLPPNTPDGIFSPDGTKRVVRGVDRANGYEDILLIDAFSNDVTQQLSHNDNYYYAPDCFLTFRPEMLIDDSL